MGYAVSERGVRVPAGLAGAVDVLFGEDRVWSFDPADERWPLNRGWVPWPSRLDGYLVGTADVRLVLRGTGAAPYAQRVRFSEGGPDPLRLQDDDGNLLSIDKAGLLGRSFTDTGPEAITALLDSVERVLHDLRVHGGVEPFLAFGCLLGAVREGKVIGHDGDADVAYVSEHTHPFDIIRENRRLGETMRGLGWSITRMSAADFKIWVRAEEGDRRIGIDVFTGFRVEDTFHLMPTVAGDLPMSAILPLGEVTLEGRRLPAPADPEAFLEVLYGAGWRVPDPTFHDEPTRLTTRRFDGWMRGNQRYNRYWNDFYRSRAADRIPTEPSGFARWVGERLTTPRHVLDVGAGNGRDAAYFAKRGHQVTALDVSSAARRRTRRHAGRKHRQRVRPVELNFNDLRSVLLTGAQLAHLEEPPEVYARFLLDTIAPDSRQNFYRWVQMVQRRGGHTYLELRTWQSALRASRERLHYRALLSLRTVLAEIEAYGGTVVLHEHGTGLATYGQEDPHVHRLIVRWT